MGIKYLNRYFTQNCTEFSISKQSLSEFRNKVIAVDVSIYLYRFVESNMLIEGFYNMISIFKKYRITPIFVFDGKPPIEKKDLLNKRRIEKNAAEKIYNDLKTHLNKIDFTDKTIDARELREKQQEILNEMDTLKKRFVRIRPQDIISVKKLMHAYGTYYIESDGEADQLCAYLVCHNIAWACISDDMDMFLYGCTRVIRHISLVNHTGILYHTPSILEELHMSHSEFRDIMILSGTDYNIHQKTHLYDIIQYYNQYNEARPDMPFYEWLSVNTAVIVDTAILDKIRSMFDLVDFKSENKEKIHEIGKMSFYRKVDTQTLREVLHSDGFIFVT